ncbi:UNVERIFIED_CONTAM: hypothetical protein HHA_217855 [Hammondia hammondi]|eukprot:XP_008889258.1 hypothetical protein HHA_217855 [Hammondia hammondi]
MFSNFIPGSVLNREGVYKFCPLHDGLECFLRPEVRADLESAAFSANCSGSHMVTQVTARLRRAQQLQVTFEESEEPKLAF